MVVGASVVVGGAVEVVVTGASVVVVAVVPSVVPGATVVDVGAVVVAPGVVVVVCPEMLGDSANAGEAPPSATLEITGTATALAARATFTTFLRDTFTGSNGSG